MRVLTAFLAAVFAFSLSAAGGKEKTEEASAKEPALPSEPARPVQPGEAGGRWNFGIRAALMLPGTGEHRDYGASALLGVTLSPPKGEGSSVSLELGLDYGGWGPESEGYSSQLVGGRFEVLFSLREGSRHSRAYLLSGVGTVVEFVEDKAREENYVNSAAVLDLGGGYVFVGGKLDARLTYSFFLGSGNLGRQTLLSVGYGF